MNLSKAVKRRLYPTISKHVSRAVLVEGVLKGTGLRLRCLFVDNSRFTHYVLGRMYTRPVRTVREWKLWIPALRRPVTRQGGEFDLCIAVLPRIYESVFRGLYAFRGQEYVQQEIDTSGTWDEIKARFHKKKRRLSNSMFEKNGFAYRVSADERDFDLFYHRMHLPLIKKQFGDLANIETYESMKKVFSKGLLLLVTRHDKPVAGNLCHIRNGVLTAYKAGVLDGDDRHVRDGVQMALYYYCLRFAHEQNLMKVNAARSRPFLNDGVYRTKLEWGAATRPDDESGSWVYFFIPRLSREVSRFFEDNPFVAGTEDGLMAVVGTRGNGTISEEYGRTLARQFCSPGIGGLLLLSPDAGSLISFPFKDAAAAAPA